MTSTDYEHPFRPAPVRLLNRLGRAGSNLGLSDRLDAEALREAARRKTGLSDFGDDGHAEALEVLVTSINAEARLSATGRLIQRSRLTGALVQRLRISELLRRHPEIADIDLGTVIVITGLQRTGTTLLHRLLISHPDFRGLSGAEALMPVPGAPDSDRAERARKRQAVLAQKSISYLAPEFMAIHPISHDEPEEDVLLLDLCFMSQSAEATMHVPTYARWLEAQDHTPAYEYLRQVLQVLSWQRPGRTWVLKTPHHLEHLDVLLRVFEGATVVQTHRDPRIALASFCSMVAHGRGMFSDQVDPVEIGRHWSAKTHRMVMRAMEVRAESPAGQFVDVSYYDLMADPVAEVRRICEHAGIPFDERASGAATQYLEANPKNRFGRHDYRLGDFGLTDDTIDETFAAYREAYAIPIESDQRRSAEQPAAEQPADAGQPGRGLGDSNFVGALVTAVRDLRNPKAPDVDRVPDDVRIDGKTCLVTGANSGLGRAAAVELARRGGRMILACRPGHDTICDEIKRESGSESAELVEVDLADLRSVHRSCDELRDRGARVDIALMNAGLMTPAARQSPQGYDTMLAVHFLANRVMIDRWLADGVIDPSQAGGDTPRIVFVSSEAHRSSADLDIERLDAFTPYGMRDAMRHYGLSKLALCTYATELSRRLNPGDGVDVAVHSLCPGGVATNIAREAPPMLKPVVDPALRRLFRSPADAIDPVIYLCCAPEAGSSTGLYLHLMHRKQVSERASDPANGTKLWEASQVLVEESRGIR
ncbi:MAG: SDR family NAD(P)-dependent oxidoreductase [Acidimicrobiales bacterium]|nr:SDR family NAD(P)-dependent oxidoreductase [Acidimicrobiales bacterium]MYH75381.1 SDR family NAD(P)-dependent oxidoreductase [Acidimicrobiales bacterium]MYK70349.1 SDR family NAD(P)-dependent oxidoreductase [Acidimicrobiales bacterium]